MPEYYKIGCICLRNNTVGLLINVLQSACRMKIFSNLSVSFLTTNVSQPSAGITQISDLTLKVLHMIWVGLVIPAVEAERIS